MDDPWTRKTKQRWERYAATLSTSLHVIIDPDLYLLDELGSAEPQQEELDRGIAQAVQVYRDALTQSMAETGLPEALPLMQQQYTPPLLWQTGGLIGAPWEIIEVAGSAAAFIAQAISEEAVGAGLWKALDTFQRFRRAHGDETLQPTIPVHSPQALRLMCAGHAVETHDRLGPRRNASQCRVLDTVGANYPSAEVPVMVIVPAKPGSIVYLVSPRLVLLAHFLADRDGGMDLEPRIWPGQLVPRRSGAAAEAAS